MKVTLIWPPSPFLMDQRAFPPLGVLYLAAYLEANGVQVDVADMTDREDDLEAALIPHTGADLYGVSSATPQYPQSLRILDIIRRHNPDATTVIGGPHASSRDTAYSKTSTRARGIGMSGCFPRRISRRPA